MTYLIYTLIGLAIWFVVALLIVAPMMYVAGRAEREAERIHRRIMWMGNHYEE